jgi:hypothetical protein
MKDQPSVEARTVAVRLRAVVYAYVAANIAVAALLLTTVTLTPPAQAGHQEIALR